MEYIKKTIIDYTLTEYNKAFIKTLYQAMSQYLNDNGYNMEPSTTDIDISLPDDNSVQFGSYDEFDKNLKPSEAIKEFAILTNGLLKDRLQVLCLAGDKMLSFTVTGSNEVIQETISLDLYRIVSEIKEIKESIGSISNQGMKNAFLESVEDEKAMINKYNEQCIKAVKNFYKKNKDSLDNTYQYYIESLNEELLYKKVSNESLPFFLKDATILILTATKIETGILHNRISKSTHKKIVQIRHGNITYYFSNWGKQKIVHVWQDAIGSESRGGSADTLRDVFEKFIPKTIISLGICFGIDFEKQNIGDVLLADKIFPYDIGIKMDAGSIRIKEDNTFRTVQDVTHGLRQMRSLTDSAHLTPMGTYRAFVGHFLTGEAVVSDEKYKRTICKAYKGIDFLGGEMEGYGVYKEAGRKHVPCIIIKGICDWGTVKNGLSRKPKENEHIKDSLQTYAMYNACDVCETLLKDNQVFNSGEGEEDIPNINAKEKGALKKWLTISVSVITLAAIVIILLFTDLLKQDQKANSQITIGPSSIPSADAIPVLIGGVEYSTGLKTLDLSHDDDYTHMLDDSDIIGLKYMTNLEELDLSYNEISDITPLQGLTSLKKLTLSNNTRYGIIINLIPLMNLSKLEELDISSNELTSIDVVKYLPNLRILDASNNDITNFHPLNGRRYLEKLDISNNKAETLNLGTLESLKSLNASSCEFKSIDFSDNNVFLNLKFLNLAFNEFEMSDYEWEYEFGSIQSISNLEILDLTGCNITDITYLGKLINLKKLSLYGNNVTDIDTLIKLNNLEYLHLGGNPVQDVSCLASLKKLEYLELSNLYYSSRLWESGIFARRTGQSFSGLGPLSKLHNVTTLGLAGNHLTDISALSAMKQIKTLDLRYNNIENIDALSSLENLQALRLEWNKVKNLSPLSSLPLTDLHIDGNEISDISALKDNNELMILNCGVSSDIIMQYSYDPKSEYYKEDPNTDDDIFIDRDRYNFISDISSLATLKELKTLNLDGNPIRDLGTLAGLSKLENLSIKSKSAIIEDWTPVAHVTNVER